MSGLFSALHSAAGALNIFSQALGVDQQNVANASTPGYAAQTATIVAAGISGVSGADFLQVTSNSNRFADAAVQAASSQASQSQTTAQQLGPVNQLFDITGTSGILAALQQFSTAFSTLSVTPNDPAAGATAISAARGVASAFNQVAASLTNQKTQLNSAIQSTTDQINSLANQIRKLNVAATASSQANPGVDTALRNSLDQLSSLVDITVTKDANGSVSVLAGGQLPLVIGDQSYQLSVDPSQAAGSQVTSSAGGNSPGAFSGQLGGLLQSSAAINAIYGPGNSGSLNTLAGGFASLVNNLLTSGTNAAGNPGAPIFTYDAANPAGSAGTLAIDPTVTADQLGLATTGAGAQSNGIANQLAGLAGSTAAASQIGGQSAEGLFASIAASVGQQLSDATTASSTDQTSLTSAQTNRQQQIGTSLDQEAINITTNQRAYAANAQVVTILNQLTQVEIDLISGR
ncbi:MAG TPA: flagellar hook-associated protein FlgK [Bryobacteraceae bacterium]|jgi:flagellar hook-associated protein 1 FlgK|nr:flagellar hook-associated protein FlgK [Bryobacteraceae bacterium]